jgi:hypothetical protein
MEPRPNPLRQALTGDRAVLLYPALFKLALQLSVANGYGYFRDELYFLACADHLDWGYVDMPPGVAVVAAFSRWLLGDSPLALRFFSAVAGAALVYLTGVLARELGGGRRAAFLAQLAVLVGGVYMVIAYLLSMNVYEQLLWTLAAWLVIRIAKDGNQRLWLWFGVVAGVGLQFKHSMAFFAFAVVVGLLLTAERRALAQRWIWIGGAVAFVIFLPNLVWQVQHGWPTLELLHNVKATGKNIVLGPVGFLVRQADMLNFLTAPVWLGGLWFFFFHREGKRWRALGWTYVVLLVTMFALEAKPYYLAPIYPLLFAAGAVAWEPLLRRSRLALGSYVAVLVAGGTLAALVALPILPPESYLAFTRQLGFTPPRTEVSHTSEMPQHLADQFGWPELVEKVAEVYHRLPPEERAGAAIFANNYGQAGAVDFIGPRYGLPRAISGHQNYFLWGPRGASGEVLITIGESPEDVLKSFEQVEVAAQPYHPYAMPEENRHPICIARRPRMPVEDLWPLVKKYR